MNKYTFLPVFLFFAVCRSFPVAAQTELDARAQAAAYGKEYVPVPKTMSVLTPALLEGIWQGSDRYVFFVKPSDTAVQASQRQQGYAGAIVNPVDPPASVVQDAAAAALPSDMAVVLKTYYGWFYDRAAEPASYASDSARFRCTATTKDAERITVTYEPLQNRTPRLDVSGTAVPEDSGAWELVVRYGTKQRNVTRIPVAVIGNNLYLNFVLKGRTSAPSDSSDTDPLSGFWQGVSRQSSIRISPQPMNENLTSYYVTASAVYTLRYWLTTMEYTDAYASFSDGSETFRAAKHIISDGNIFTCVTGRSLQIRNVEKTTAKLTDYTLDSTGTICAFGKPYLVKVTGKDNAPALMQIVAEANKRRKQDPPPLFPPDNLNWHWDLIRLLEKDNTQIQAVRQRQKEFAETNGREGRIDAVQAAAYSSYTKLEQSVTPSAGK